MKHINKKPIIVLLATFILLFSCKKDEATSGGSTVKDVIATKDFVYNLATKGITPDVDINANIKSEVGIKLIYSYLVRSDRTDSLVNVAYATADNQKDYTLNIPTAAFVKANMATATAIKTVIKRIDNSSNEGLIKLTSFQPPLPKLENFPVSKLPDATNQVSITGKVTSETGLNRIEILDDSQGAFSLVTTLAGLNGAKTYDVNYNYTYRANTANVKIIAYDNFNIKAEVTIRIPALPYTLYQNINMGAQGSLTVTVNNNHFFTNTGTTAGSCSLNANEETMDFLFYGISTGPAFYSPTNTATVAVNYRCNGVGWVITDISKMKATRFRVLVPGTPEVDAVYSKFNANTIVDLNETGFFNGIAVPVGSTARFDPVNLPSASLFNLTNAYLIWVRIPKPDGTFRNCIIRAREAVAASTLGLSTVKFDIYVQK